MVRQGPGAQVSQTQRTQRIQSILDERLRRRAAGELGRDIAAFLAGDPVAAKQGSGLYVLRKTAARHRSLAAAVAAVVAVLSTGSAVKGKPALLDTYQKNVNEVREKFETCQPTYAVESVQPLGDGDRWRIVRELSTEARTDGDVAAAQPGEPASKSKNDKPAAGGDKPFALTFRTVEPAPEDFDAFEFFWAPPYVDKDAQVTLRVLDAAGREQQRWDGVSGAHGRSRHSVWADAPEQPVDLKTFRGGKISVVLEVSKGTMKFPPGTEFAFAFYRKDANGEIAWQKPYKTIAAVTEPKESLEFAKELTPADLAHPVTFRTREHAPAQFDAWQFFLSTPLRDAEARMGFFVLDPNGSVHFTSEIPFVEAGEQERSSFAPDSGGGDPAVFFGKDIRFVLGVTNGPMKFAPDTKFHFAFYKKGPDGKIDWRGPGFAQIDAVADPAGTLELLPAGHPLAILPSSDWDRRSSKRIARLYRKEWLVQLADARAWKAFLRAGFALYDVRRYDDALEVFKATASSAQGHAARKATALIWQGHMLDLLGRRQEAIAVYQKVADMHVGRTMEHSQYGLRYSPSEYAAERIKTPFERIENKQKGSP